MTVECPSQQSESSCWGKKLHPVNITGAEQMSILSVAIVCRVSVDPYQADIEVVLDLTGMGKWRIGCGESIDLYIDWL